MLSGKSCESTRSRIALKSNTNMFLARCTNCIPNANFAESAFVETPDWRTTPRAQWTVEVLANGKIALKSDSGRYLSRCNQCAAGDPPNRAFVQATSSADAVAQWTVKCLGPP
ncbi:hypothetical protein PINS_up013085 [Pythium insidiosum]|nr:hypothetical protein PINS_up013085 [Pythium insidiosum]